MVSQRDLNKLLEQINSSYARLVARVDKLEAKPVPSTNKKESKDKP